MKERPILFSGPMVRAILAGTKSQTRRIVKPQPPEGHVWAGWCVTSTCRADEGKAVWAASREPLLRDPHRVRCPYGRPGDRLYVKESIRRIGKPSDDDERLCESEYIADGTRTAAYCWPWENKALPSIHCPRSLSRITLEIVSVRVERLQAISEADAISEGVTAVSSGGVTLFATNGPGSWDANPWVWCISFKVI